ncbi:MAG: hypothetical protein IJY18_01455 [Clostridia bacterium]|nr:hypothetical protein [Clostridia bacterium]
MLVNKSSKNGQKTVVLIVKKMTFKKGFRKFISIFGENDEGCGARLGKLP